MLTPEQLIEAQKNNVETIFGLTTKTFEGVKSLVELNVQVAETTLSEIAENTKAALSVKDAQGLLALQASLLQPMVEKNSAYTRYVYDIVRRIIADVSKVAEEKAGEAQRSFSSYVETAAKNAPAGSENAVTLVRSAVAAANNVYESAQRAAKQASDVAEANFQAITNSAVKASQQVGAKAKRGTTAAAA